MRQPTEAEMLRLLKKQRENLRYSIAETRARIVGMETELLRTEIAIEDLETAKAEGDGKGAIE